MPYSGYKRKRSYAKKYKGTVIPYRKKLAIARQLGSGATGIRYFKMRYTSVVQSDAGGVISIFSCADPQKSWSGGGAVEDFSSISSLFDSIRVKGMKWHFIPNFPNDTSVTTGFFPLYTVFDVDASAQVLTTAASAIQYENFKVFNMYRPWTRYDKVMPTSASKQQGWADMATTADLYGAMCGWGSGFDTSTTYGNMIVTYYIECKDRR